MTTRVLIVSQYVRMSESVSSTCAGESVNSPCWYGLMSKNIKEMSDFDA